jgi:hypothetical protein
MSKTIHSSRQGFCFFIYSPEQMHFSHWYTMHLIPAGRKSRNSVYTSLPDCKVNVVCSYSVDSAFNVKVKWWIVSSLVTRELRNSEHIEGIWCYFGAHSTLSWVCVPLDNGEYRPLQPLGGATSVIYFLWESNWRYIAEQSASFTLVIMQRKRAFVDFFLVLLDIRIRVIITHPQMYVFEHSS